MMRSCTAVARVLTVGVLMACAGYATAQQVYPSKPIRFIVPFPPGGTTTPLARLVGEKLTENWGQPVLIDNRGGGNTIIGTETLTKSPPDGYTIMLVSSVHTIVPHLYDKLPYDAIKDFAPVATLVGAEFVLVLHPSVPANNLQEFIALAKSKPGQLNYASGGSGSTNHLAAALFASRVGVKMQHIPYKGGGPALTDLIGGQVQMFMNNPLTLIPHIKSAKIKAIAISGETRSPALPQVPTFSEGGLPGYDVKWWQGILAPAGTPNAFIDKLSTEVARILAMPDIKEKLLNQGVEPFISSPDQFTALMKADMAKWGKVIKTANIKLE